MEIALRNGGCHPPRHLGGCDRSGFTAFRAPRIHALWIHPERKESYRAWNGIITGARRGFLDERARDWLTPAFHAVFHKLMPHAATRERLLCTAYCLMPDHLHLLWMGLRRESDQFNAMKFLRTQLEPALGNGREWQHQPHDHVLLEEERRRNAFARFCFYTLANPVRAGLVTREHDWSCLFVLCLETWGPDFRRSWILQLRSHTAYERRTRIAFPEKLMKLS